MAAAGRTYKGEVIQSDNKDELILLKRMPIGVIAGILPWNFPFFLIARKMAPALVTGNTIVLKPSSDTPIGAWNLPSSVTRSVFQLGLSTLSPDQVPWSATSCPRTQRSAWRA